MFRFTDLTRSLPTCHEVNRISFGINSTSRPTAEDDDDDDDDDGHNTTYHDTSDGATTHATPVMMYENSHAHS